MRLGATRIVTDHVPTLARFYEVLTGIRAVGCGEHYAEIETLGGVLAICSEEAVALFNRGAAIPKANRSVIIEFEVEDVDREHARLAGIIGALVMEPTDQPWGNRSLLFRDPDGNLINIYSAMKMS